MVQHFKHDDGYYLEPSILLKSSCYHLIYNPIFIPTQISRNQLLLITDTSIIINLRFENKIKWDVHNPA